MENIEVVVSDNASTDNTADLVREYQKRYQNIKYFRNDENIGANRNLFRVAECASGKYIWFMGDDDIIDEGGLARVLYFLNTCSNTVLIQTNILDELDDGMIIQNGVEYWKRLVDSNKANTLSVFLLFLSMVIVRRSDFIHTLTEYRKQFPHKLSESFSHFYVLIRCIDKKPILLLGKVVSGGEGNTDDRGYFKNSSSKWCDLVIIKGIDKIKEDGVYLSSIGIDENYLSRFRAGFIRIYRYMQVGDILKRMGIYRPVLLMFRKFFLKKI